MPASWSLNLGSRGFDFLICKMGIKALLCDVFMLRHGSLRDFTFSGCRV